MAWTLTVRVDEHCAGTDTERSTSCCCRQWSEERCAGSIVRNEGARECLVGVRSISTVSRRRVPSCTQSAVCVYERHVHYRGAVRRRQLSNVGLAEDRQPRCEALLP